MTTPTLAHLDFEHWHFTGAAAAFFSATLDQLRTLMLPDQYEHMAAIYLAGMAKAEHRDAVPGLEGQGLGFADGLRLAKVITLDECGVLQRLFNHAAELRYSELPR